jgi:hypothetical protein
MSRVRRASALSQASLDRRVVDQATAVRGAGGVEGVGCSTLRTEHGGLAPRRTSPLQGSRRAGGQHETRPSGALSDQTRLLR